MKAVRLIVFVFCLASLVLGCDRGEGPAVSSPVTVTNVVTVTRERAGKIRFRIPAWSAEFTVNGVPGRAEKGWCTVDAPAGASAWTLGFDMTARVVPWTNRWGKRVPSSPAHHSITDVGAYTVHFMEWYSPEMAGLCRNYPGVQVMRGPLVLAKAEIAGTPADEIVSEKSIYGTTPSLKLTPKAMSGTWGCWDLEIGADGRKIPVCDFMSAGDEYKADGCRFSVWF